MSDGDESDEEGAEVATEGGADAIVNRLDAAAESLADAETEADLDDVETTVDDIEADLAETDLPEPDEDDGDEEAEDPAADLEDRIADLRDDLEAARGPYAEDVTDAVEDARSTIESTRWTDTGVEDLHDAVAAFVDAVDDVLESAVDAELGEDTDSLVAALDAAVEAVEAADLDPDADADAIAELLDAADALSAGVEDAEAYDDLSVREKLRVEGFYEALGDKHKDFPPEWSALKEWEKRDDVEMVLLLLDLMGDSDFMERHCIESLERMANPDCVDAMLERAERRDQDAIRVIGKTGHASEDVLDTFHEFVDGDPALQVVVLRALGELGSRESTQPVADQLVAETARVRSQAARALGMLGDPRAVEPLADVLGDEEEAENVRASAAWALVQIGTRDALSTAAEYADDRSYVVQSEAERAAEAVEARPA
jgi:HEAT repeat protein